MENPIYFDGFYCRCLTNFHDFLIVLFTCHDYEAAPPGPHPSWLALVRSTSVCAGGGFPRWLRGEKMEVLWGLMKGLFNMRILSNE